LGQYGSGTCGSARAALRQRLGVVLSEYHLSGADLAQRAVAVILSWDGKRDATPWFISPVFRTANLDRQEAGQGPTTYCSTTSKTTKGPVAQLVRAPDS
jgi:hypothetical protein